jgi:hypothetical protein
MSALRGHPQFAIVDPRPSTTACSSAVISAKECRPMTVPANSGERLLAAVDEAYRRATECFLQDSPASLQGVIWLSAHLAALEHAVDSTTARELPLMAEQLSAQQKLGHDLQQVLRSVEQQRAGDALAAPTPWLSERVVLLERLDRHAAGERVVILSLIETLPPESIDDLLASYTHAFQHGPTRPHLHGPRRGPFEKAMFRLSAWRDHVMDGMDSRKSPIPSSRTRRPTEGRWSRYFSAVDTSPDEDPQGSSSTDPDAGTGPAS